MFTPLYDGVPLRFIKHAYGTYAIIALNVLIFLCGISGLLGDPDRLDTALGVIPAVLFREASLEPTLTWVPPLATLVTSLFLHGGWMHLLGNMLFLFVFGDNVEDAMGPLRYLAFYLACGVAGSLAFALALPDSQAPLIGASAAISGVVAAYMMLYPRVQVFGLAFAFLPLAIPAWVFIGAWIALQAVSALMTQDSDVGWWAHVGGIVGGVCLVPMLKRREVRLFSRQLH